MDDSGSNRITADMTIDDIIARYPRAMEVLLRHSMLCAGCYISRFHDLKQSAEEFGLNVDELLVEINRAIDEKRKSE